MSVMTVPEDQLRLDWQRVIARKLREAWDSLDKNLEETEGRTVLSESDGLALRVVIQSIRAEALLHQLHRDVFAPGFAMNGTQVEENGMRSAWFGYSEPINLSRHYIPPWHCRPTGGQ
jgi:hypothetical protein